ncbi:MAG TPA: 4-hydroxyphenylacetate 3-hydroxylase family protein [Candidatus Deferrimicrobium sp.]|nr:4-hydroxyphenylacetate 3-hydroxylase family protein [Candidatus Deferrimicrobium sp.]
MPLKTPEEYLESIKKQKYNLYMFGEKIDNWYEHPIIKPTINPVKITYELAQDPRYQDVMTSISQLTRERVSRFTHVHQNTGDLVNKVKMQRLLAQHTGCCFQRCVGMDGINAVYSTTYDIDQKYGTDYHQRFINWLKKVQTEDLTVDGAMTDPKGDRGKRPSEQSDPDMFLRIVEEREDGIIVRGAKIHQTGYLNSHEVLVMPTLNMKDDEKQYSVSFAVNTATTGITCIYGRQPCDTRKMEDCLCDTGNPNYCGQEVFVIFGDVFVPKERVFMQGEYDFSGQLVTRFAGYHRQSYGGCKAGVGDVLIGATALIAEYNGVERASAVRDKLVEMVHLNETLYCCGIACSSEGHKTPAGNYEIDFLLANVCKQNVTRFPYEISRLSEDIGGGILATLPSEKDLNSEEVGPLLKKYLKANPSVSVENRFKLIRFLENASMGTTALSYKIESLHGAGSPQAQRIMIERQAELQKKKELVKKILELS